jgi:hypothetical protein
MMRLFFLCGLFAMSMAHAEVLPDSVIQQITTAVRSSCIKADTKKSGWDPDSLASICNCSQTSMDARLRIAQFSNIEKPSPTDLELVQSIISMSRKECVRAQQEKMIIADGIPHCLAGAETNAKLQNLSREDQVALCTCVAKRTARVTDFEKLNQSDRATVQAGVKAEWIASFDECARK